MSRSKIRIQYSGLIIFAAQIISVGTGLIFTLLLTRNMKTGEYGTWSNIFDLIAYFTISSGLFPFWALRFLAHGNEGTSRTGIVANLIMAIASAMVYLPLVPLITKAFNVNASYVFLYSIDSCR